MAFTTVPVSRLCQLAQHDLLAFGALPFLIVKIGFGLFTAAVLLYGSNFGLARYGVGAGLAAYTFAMGAHLFTGLAAIGFFF